MMKAIFVVAAAALLSVGAHASDSIGWVKITGSEKEYCLANDKPAGCDANYVLNGKLFRDDTVKGLLVDVVAVDDEIVLLAADLDCMKFLEGDEGQQYVVAGGVFTQGERLTDIVGLDREVVGTRFLTAAKKVYGVVSSGGFTGLTILNEDYANATCDDVDISDIEDLFNFRET